MCMHDGQAHAWCGMHLEVRRQPSPSSCWDLLVSLVSATACYGHSGLWTSGGFLCLSFPSYHKSAGSQMWTTGSSFFPLHCLIRSSDWYSKHFYPWAIFLTPGVLFFGFSICLLWKGWLYYDLCLWGWRTACRSWFSPSIIEDSGIKHVVGLGDKHPLLLNHLTGPKCSVSQVRFRTLRLFFFRNVPISFSLI